MDGASRHTRQTVTANTTPAAITWPDADGAAEAQMYVSTPNGAVEVVFDSGAADDTGIEIPDGETNYAAGRWVINSTDRPSHIRAGSSTDCEVLFLIYE